MRVYGDEIAFRINQVSNDNGFDADIKAGDADGTDKLGGSVTLRSGRGTGNQGGYIYFTVSDYGASGSTLNSLQTIGYVEYAGIVLEFPHDTQHMTYRTMRYRDAGADLQTGDITGEYRFTGMVNSNVESQASIYGKYAGDGSTTDGRLDFTVNVGSSTMEEKFAITKDRLETYVPVAYEASMVGGEITIRNKTLNIGSTTDIAEFPLPDGGQVGVEITSLMWQDDGATNKDAESETQIILATADSSGNMYVGSGGGASANAGTDGNAYVQASFVTDTVNDKVTLRITHTNGGYTPTSLAANFIIKMLTDVTPTLL